MYVPSACIIAVSLLHVPAAYMTQTEKNQSTTSFSFVPAFLVVVQAAHAALLVFSHAAACLLLAGTCTGWLYFVNEVHDNHHASCKGKATFSQPAHRH